MSSEFSQSNFGGLRLNFDYADPKSIRPSANRTRTHSKLKIKKLARSIVEHGLLVPIRVNAGLSVLGGHALLEAAISLGLTAVPIVRIEHLTAEQERLYSIAENKLAEGSEWNMDALRIELEQISIAEPTIDLSRSGFEMAERDILIGRHRTNDLVDLDDAPKLEPVAISREGELFVLGHHTLLCADSTSPEAVSEVCDGKRVRSVIADLPYNVPIAGNVSGLGSNIHREFAMASGELSKPQFTDFIGSAIAAMIPSLEPGGLLYLFMDWRHLGELYAAAENQDLDQLNLLIWAKTNAGMGSHYRSAHEEIGLFKYGDAPHINNVALGRYGRSRTNVLHYPGVNTFTKGRNKALTLHPTVKPVALIADLILDSTKDGDLVLDTFGGSGTTLIAAEKMGRVAALVELDPLYVDVTIRRWQELTGEKAVLSTGETFDDLVCARLAGQEMSDAA